MLNLAESAGNEVYVDREKIVNVVWGERKL